MTSFYTFVLITAMALIFGTGTSLVSAKRSLEKRKPMKRHYWCPTCQNTTQETCDSSLTNTTCPNAELCMALWDENIFVRKCVNEKMLELFTKGCKKVNSNEKACSRKRKYHVSWCAQSGCKAKVSKTSSDFWCPTCQNSTLKSCDASLTNTTCPKAEFCMAIQDKNIFARKCINEKMLELFTKGCKKVNSNEKACSRKRKYHVSWCAQSGCKAKVSKTASDFWCPTCQNSTLKSCDASLTNTTCPKAEFCMAIQDKNIFARKCVNEKVLELFTKGCKKVNSNEKACSRKRKYHVSWCAQSGCKAKVSKTASDFWCPTCQNSTLKSCDASLTNTTCPKAEFCMAIQDKNIFARKCVNKPFLDLISKGCKHVGDKTRECNGRRHYLVTWCDKPGCRADANEIPKATAEKAPEDSSFECPTCPICKSPAECDKKLSMTKCPKASRCMALRVNGTVVSKTVFSRNCVNEKGFLLIQRACTKKQGCEVATCTTTRCKAAL